MKGIDVDKLKKEISVRKAQSLEKSKMLGENIPDSNNKHFLKQLVESVNKGQRSEATTKISNISKLAEAKAKGKTTSGVVPSDLLEHVKQTPTSHTPKPVYQNPPMIDEKARMKKLEDEMLRQEKLRESQGISMSNRSFSQELAAFSQPTHHNNPYGGYLTEEQVKLVMSQNLSPQMLNGNTGFNTGMVVEQVNNAIKDILNENFAPLFSEALKSTIIETYKADRVKQAIEENRQLIKNIVVETILELQEKRNQSKKT